MAFESSGLGREHPGHTQQIATLPTHLMGWILGRCRNARGRCRGCWWRGACPERREPRASSWAHGLGWGRFSESSRAAFPMGTAMEEGRAPHLSSAVVAGWYLLGTLPGPSFWQPSLELCVKGQGLNTGPSQIKAPPWPPWPPWPPLAQHLASSHDQKHRV